MPEKTHAEFAGGNRPFAGWSCLGIRKSDRAVARWPIANDRQLFLLEGLGNGLSGSHNLTVL
jgi:hypothetical protein